MSVARSDDVGLPFWCDWSYDWEERCYRDDGARLPIGGSNDKVWRAALRFSLSQVPGSAEIASVPCGELGYVVDAHRILSSSWFREREVELDDRSLYAEVVLAGWTPQWLVWDVTELVRAWHRQLVPNNGLLLTLQDGDEAFG